MHTWQIDEPYISNRPFAGLDHVTILKQKLWHTITTLKMPQMERAQEN